MVRRFLFILFDTFILLVIFISLFQYSAANLNLGGLEKVFNSDNYFGFQSLFTFTTDLGNNTEILDAWNDAINWLTQCITWLTKNIQNAWDKATNVAGGFNPLKAVINGITLIIVILSSPIVLGIGLGGIIVYIFRFIWLLLTMGFKLILGYYNTPIVHVGNITPSSIYFLV